MSNGTAEFRDEMRSELCAGCAAYLGTVANSLLASKSSEGCDRKRQRAVL